MVRVSACPYLTKGLGCSQVTLSEMLALNGCKMLPLKWSHCFVAKGRRNGTLVSCHKFYKLVSKLNLVFRNTGTVDHLSQPFPSSLLSHQFSVIS